MRRYRTADGVYGIGISHDPYGEWVIQFSKWCWVFNDAFKEE